MTTTAETAAKILDSTQTAASYTAVRLLRWCSKLFGRDEGWGGGKELVGEKCPSEQRSVSQLLLFPLLLVSVESPTTEDRWRQVETTSSQVQSSKSKRPMPAALRGGFFITFWGLAVAAAAVIQYWLCGGDTWSSSPSCHPPAHKCRKRRRKRKKQKSITTTTTSCHQASVGRSVDWVDGWWRSFPPTQTHNWAANIKHTHTQREKEGREGETPTQHKVEKRIDRSISDLNKRKESGRSLCLCSRLTSNSDVVVTMIQVDGRVAGGIVTTRSSRILLSVERADDGRNGAHVSDRHDRRRRGASGGNDEKLLLLLLLRWSRRRTGYGCNILNGFNLGRNDHHGRFFNQLAATVVVHLSLLLLLLAVDNNQTHRDAQLIDWQVESSQVKCSAAGGSRGIWQQQQRRRPDAPTFPPVSFRESLEQLTKFGGGSTAQHGTAARDLQQEQEQELRSSEKG